MSTISHPISTEKVVRLMNKENKLVFIVNKKATKEEIKIDFEKMFKVKVEKINTLIQKGVKKAYIKLDKGNKAIDVATQLGLI